MTARSWGWTFVALALLCTAAARAEIAMRDYALPEGMGPHDVAPAPDGGVWFTAQPQGALGRLDPATGKVETIDLGEGSAPHGVIVGADGAAWVTDGGANAIARVDAGTLAVKRFPRRHFIAGEAELSGPGLGRDPVHQHAFWAVQAPDEPHDWWGGSRDN